MKAKRMVLIGAMVFGMMCLLPTNTNAACQWYTCSIVELGQASSVTYIRLTDTAESPAFNSKWFIAPANKAKEILALALTAMTNDMKVQVYADLAAGVYPSLWTFYLKK
jgi:hypothetical protein